MNAKPWQLALIVLGLLGGTGLVVYNLFFVGRGPDLASTLKVIDVNTGECFEVDLAGKGYGMPGKNPATLKRSLMEIDRDEDGTWVIPQRFRSMLSNVDVEIKVVDANTGEVNVPVDAFTRMDHPTKWDRSLAR